MRCSMCTTCNVSRRIKGRYTRTRKRYTGLSDLRIGALFRYVYTRKFWSQDFGATKMCRASTSPTKLRRNRTRRFVILVTFRLDPWARFYGEERRYSNICCPNRTAIYNRGIYTGCISDIAPSFPPDTDNVEDEPERIAIDKISSVSIIRNGIFSNFFLNYDIVCFLFAITKWINFNSLHLLYACKI